MKVLIVPAPFKECVGQKTLGKLLSNCVLKILPKAKVTTLILSDGGTGFAQWLVDLTQGTFRNVYVKRLDGIEILSRLGVIRDNTAVIEIAQMLGIALVPPSRRKPLLFSSI